MSTTDHASIEVMPQEETAGSKKAGSQAFLRLLKETKPPMLLLIGAILLNVISTLVGLVIPMFTKSLVDGFSLTDMNRTHIVGLGIAFVVQTIAAGISIFLLSYTGQKMVAALRERLWKKLLVLPIRYFDHHRSGESVSRMTNDTGVIKSLISDHVAGFLSGIISIVGSVGVLLYLNWQMTLTMFIVIPFAALILVPLGRKMYKISLGMQTRQLRLRRISVRCCRRSAWLRLQMQRIENMRTGTRALPTC